MHEIGIATSILNAGHTEVERRPGAKLVSIGVRVGVLSGVDVAALRFAFECLVTKTEDEHVVLLTESCPRRNRCRRCGVEFSSPGSSFLDAPCPECSSGDTVVVSGDELDLSFIELEDA